MTKMRDDHPFRKKGSGHPRSKLTDADRAFIRESFEMGFRQKLLAHRYNVSISTIHRVCKA